MAKRKITKKQMKKHQEIKYYIIALIAIAIIFISLFRLGSAGVFLDNLFKNIFGTIPSYFALIQLLCYFGYMLVQAKPLSLLSRYVIGSILALIGSMLLLASIEVKDIGFQTIDFKMISSSNIGVIQLLLYALFSQFFSKAGTALIAIIIIIIGLIIYFMISLSTFIKQKKENISNYSKIKKEEKALKLAAKKELEENNIEKKSKIKDFFQKNESISDKESIDEIVIDDNVNEVNDSNSDSIDDDELHDIPFDVEDVVFDKEKHIEKEIEIEKNIKSYARDYKLPSFDLLKNPLTSDARQVNKAYANEKAKILIDFFKEFNLDIKVDKINIGPSITKFELILSAGTRVNRIASLSDDIKMALAVKEIRIEAPIPGKSAVGIEIPNAKNTLITLKEVLNDIDYEKENKLVFGLGKDINGKSIYTSLNTMPHLLVAGSTGSGKSVCINSIITSILMNAHYDQVKLLLIDPKKVELNIYNDIPHLLSPVISDPKAASVALRKIVEEMDRRYQVLSNYNTKNIEKYNEYATKFNKKIDDDSLKLEILPYVVVIIDELADLMMVSAKEVEECIMRITQMARAAGIHLIVATQRPSTDVITGIIKANIPSRIAFAVSSSIDSRTILDMVGAEKLLGKGDMLFYPTGMSSPMRVQGAYLSDDEVAKIVYDIKKQHIITKTAASFDNLENNIENGNANSDDELYFEVEEFVKRQDTISTSRLQRQFKIGYNRAANLIEDLHMNNVISAQNGSKPRDVLIRNEELE